MNKYFKTYIFNRKKQLDGGRQLILLHELDYFDHNLINESGFIYLLLHTKDPFEINEKLGFRIYEITEKLENDDYYYILEKSESPYDIYQFLKKTKVSSFKKFISTELAQENDDIDYRHLITINEIAKIYVEVKTPISDELIYGLLIYTNDIKGLINILGKYFINYILMLGEYDILDLLNEIKRAHTVKNYDVFYDEVLKYYPNI